METNNDNPINIDKSTECKNDFEPKLTNIDEKMVFTYKQLTDLLEIKYYSGGKSKQYQLDLLKCYMDYLKKGTKFYIKKIYDNNTVESLLKKRNDKISRKNIGLYIKYIEWILLNELSKTEGNTFSLTPKKIYKLLGMANDKYFYRNYELGTDKEIEADRIRFVKNEVPLAGSSDINDFFIRTNDKFRKTLSDSLKSLKSRRLIDYWDEKIIVMLPEIPSEDDDAFVHINEYTDSIVANEYQIEKILQAERTILDRLNLERVEHVYLTKRAKEFFTKVGDIINKYGWDYYYKQIKIVYNKVNAENHIHILENEIIKLRKELNNELINSMNKQIEKKQEDIDFAFEFIEDESNPSDRKISTYEDIQKALVEKLIRL